jgi:hypothetical protein
MDWVLGDLRRSSFEGWQDTRHETLPRCLPPQRGKERERGREGGGVREGERERERERGWSAAKILRSDLS